MEEGKIEKYKEVATFILYQQLFLEPNLIRDRRTKVRITVKGSGRIIEKMHQLVMKHIKMWDVGKEKEYIKELTQKLKVDTHTVMVGYDHKTSPLEEDQLKDKSFKFLLLLSEAIKEIQEKSTKKVIKELMESLKEELTREEISKKLDLLSQQSDVNFSLLINLGILCEYAKITQEPEPKEVYQEYLEKVIALIKKD